MNLQHFAHQDKRKTKKIIDKAVFYQDKELQHQAIPSEQFISHKQFNIDSEYYFRCKVYDLIEGYTDWYMPKGNHCIIGDKRQIKTLTDYLMKACDGQINLISVLDFLQFGVRRSLLNDDIHLIAIELEATSPQLISEVISKCHQVFFYRPSNILKYCRYKQEYNVPVHLKSLVSEIAPNLGIDTTQVLDILSGMLTDEFLEVSKVNGRKAVKKLPIKALPISE